MLVMSWLNLRSIQGIQDNLYQFKVSGHLYRQKNVNENLPEVVPEGLPACPARPAEGPEPDQATPLLMSLERPYHLPQYQQPAT